MKIRRLYLIIVDSNHSFLTVPGNSKSIPSSSSSIGSKVNTYSSSTYRQNAAALMDQIKRDMKDHKRSFSGNSDVSHLTTHVGQHECVCHFNFHMVLILISLVKGIKKIRNVQSIPQVTVALHLQNLTLRVTRPAREKPNDMMTAVKRWLISFLTVPCEQKFYPQA